MMRTWVCTSCGATAQISQDWIEDNGTPCCGTLGCAQEGVDMELQEAYDGSRCPVCDSEEVIAGDSTPEGASLIWRNCHCGQCGAIWTERLEVTGYDNLEEYKEHMDTRP